MSLYANPPDRTRTASCSPFRRVAMRGGMLLMLLLPATCLLRAQATAPSAAQSSNANSSTTVSTVVTTAGAKPAAVLANPTPDQKSPHLVGIPGPAPEDVNRKALEQLAGKDAGKLLVRSTPNRARIYINAAFVGYTPQLFLLAPGKYRVEMRGPRDNIVERTVGLLPNDTLEMKLNVMEKYPRHVTSH